MGEFAIGQGVSRFEDPKLVQGQGYFIDDVVYPGMAFGVVLRSPHAYAKIASIDTQAAKAAPGVLAVLTAAAIKAAGIGDLPGNPGLKRRGGAAMHSPRYPVLADGYVRWVGDCVAFIVADPADITVGQHRIARRMHRRAAAALETGIAGQIANARGLDVGGGEHREHARRCLGGLRVDRSDLGVGVRRAQHDAKRHAWINYVVDEIALALHQLRIFEARYALTDCEFTHCNDYLSISGGHRTVTGGGKALSA